jgi:iron complex transport system substrate-binding protein
MSRRVFFLLALILWNTPLPAAVTVVDGMGRTVTLDSPARRIVSLAPHVAELLFAAGAGGRVVGTVRYSDYPEAARRIPRIGDAAQLDMERIVSLKPDLVVAWHSSLDADTRARLMALGFTLYISEPHALTDIAADITNLGRLAGTEAPAQAAASSFTDGLRKLRLKYRDTPPVAVFYQVWDRPVMTVNGNHFISHLLSLCGGRNVFADLEPLSAAVSPEAVVAADPQAMVAGVGAGLHRDVFARWRDWTMVDAVRMDNLFTIPADLINRPTPRLLQAARRLCRALDTARRRMDKAGAAAHNAHAKGLSLSP